MAIKTFLKSFKFHLWVIIMFNAIQLQPTHWGYYHSLRQFNISFVVNESWPGIKIYHHLLEK